MRFLLLCLIGSGCVAHHTPAWVPTIAEEAQRSLTRDSLVERSRAALAAGRDEEALTLAERALATHESLRRLAAGRAAPARVFTAATVDDLPALVAYADALFAWSEQRSLHTLLDRQDWIRAAALRAVALDRTAEHGAPDRILAMLEATLPTLEGANLIDALERFEAAIATAPAYLPTRVAYAERYAARVGDERLFAELLDQVLASDPDALPDCARANREAQSRARWLRGVPPR